MVVLGLVVGALVASSGGVIAWVKFKIRVKVKIPTSGMGTRSGALIQRRLFVTNKSIRNALHHFSRPVHHSPYRQAPSSFPQ